MQKFSASKKLGRSLLTLLAVMAMLTALLCIRFVYPLFFAPSLAALIGSLLVEPMFRPYIQEDAAA